MEDHEVEALVTAYNEQAQELGRLRTYVQISRAKGAATRARNKEKERRRKTHYFVKVMRTANQKACRAHLFTPTEMQLLFSITPFVDFDGIVKMEDHSPMSIKDIAMLCDWGKTTTSKTIRSLVTKGVLEKLPDGQMDRIKVCRDYIKCG